VTNVFLSLDQIIHIINLKKKFDEHFKRK